MSPVILAYILMGLAILCASLFGVMIRLASDAGGDLHTILMFRNLFGLVAVLLFFVGKRREKIVTNNLIHHIGRSVIATTAIGLYIYTIAHLPLANAATLQFAMPLFLPLVSYYFFREIPKPISYSMLVLALMGALLIADPSSQEFVPIVTLAGVFGAFLTAVVTNYGKKILLVDNIWTLIFWFSLIPTILTFPWYVYEGIGIPIKEVAVYSSIAGVLANMHQFLSLSAYKYLNSTSLGAMTYLTVPMVLFFGWFFFSELPSMAAIIGIGIILSANALNFIYQNKAKAFKHE